MRLFEEKKLWPNFFALLPQKLAVFVENVHIFMNNSIYTKNEYLF